jgi:hypothetical protein
MIIEKVWSSFNVPDALNYLKGMERLFIESTSVEK